MTALAFFPILKMTFGDVDWAEIIYTVVGSFVGLFVALGADKIGEFFSERSRLSTIRNAIKGELIGIRNDLNSINELDDQNSNYLKNTLEAECIVWDSVKSSDIFIELIHAHNDEYGRLITIYNKLAYLNRYEDKYDAMEINNSPLNRSAIIKNIRLLRCQIVDNINEYLERFD